MGKKNTNVKKRCVVWAYCYLEDNLKKKKLNSRHQNITALYIIYDLYIISYNTSYFSTSPIGIFEYLSLSSISEVEKELVICIGLNLKNINEYRPVYYAGLIFFSINPLIQVCEEEGNIFLISCMALQKKWRVVVATCLFFP